MDALQRVARDCRALLVSVQLTLFALFVSGRSFAVAVLFAGVATLVVVFVVFRAVVVTGGAVESTLY